MQMSPMRATVRKHAATPVTEASHFYGQCAGLYCRCQDLSCLCKSYCTERPGADGAECEWCAACWRGRAETAPSEEAPMVDSGQCPRENRDGERCVKGERHPGPCRWSYLSSRMQRSTLDALLVRTEDAPYYWSGSPAARALLAWAYIRTEETETPAGRCLRVYLTERGRRVAKDLPR